MGDTLPQGWRRIKFGEIIASSVYGTSVSSQNGGNTPIVGMGQLQDGKVILKNLERVPLSDNERQKLSLKRGDLLFNRTNSEALVGKIGIVLEDAEAVFASYLVRFRVKEDSASPDYINFIFNLPKIQKALSRFITKGVSQCNVNPTKLCKELDIPLPPLEEQRKLVSLIKFWNETTDQLQSLLERKRECKRALMQRLLDVRFNDNEHWKEYHLGDLFKERVDTRHLDLPLLSITREKGVIPRGDVERKDTSNEDKSKYLRICVGDIGYNTMRMWQGVSALSSLEGIVSPAYTILIPSDQIDGQFAGYLFKYTPIVHLFQRYSQGLTSDTWNLKYPHFAEIKVHIPPLPEQRKIAAVLAAADREIDQLTQKLDAYKQQKKGLMQQLLTGKKRVKLDHKEAA